MQFLIDTGCTANLLSKTVFDKLPERVEELSEESNYHGLLTDGTQLPFCGIIWQPIPARDVTAEEAFVVNQICKHTILACLSW